MARSPTNAQALCDDAGRCWQMLADAGMRKTCKDRLYPTNEQRRLLQRQLAECRWLYHHLLAERRDAWEQRQESVRLDDQHATLPARKAERPTLAGGQSPVLQDVARTSRSALIWPSRRSSAACRRVEPAPGAPRCRGAGRYESRTFPQVPVGGTLDAERKRVCADDRRTPPTGLSASPGRQAQDGDEPPRQHRQVARHLLRCACAEPAPWPETGRPVGLDVGLKTVAMPTPGEPIANPRFFRRDEHALAGAQRRLSREAKGAPARGERRRVVARVQERIAWRRGDFAHQHGRRLVNPCDLLAVEDLSVNRMVHTTIGSPRASMTRRGPGSRTSSPPRQHGPVGGRSP